MGSNGLAGLYEAIHTIEQLKTNITMQATKLAEIQNNEFKDILRNTNEHFDLACLFVDILTKVLEFYVKYPDARETFVENLFKAYDKQMRILILAAGSALLDDVNRLEIHAEKNKNTIGEEYAKEIKDYTELLRKFIEALSKFGEELAKSIGTLPST
ncbi:hypothetical protein [Saccharolobus sp.]|uniref:hypothetical protein n=1 Tax=Saccharolobus sp. TaxID=2100761 RepID=UPI00316D8168